MTRMQRCKASARSWGGVKRPPAGRVGRWPGLWPVQGEYLRQEEAGGV